VPLLFTNDHHKTNSDATSFTPTPQQSFAWVYVDAFDQKVDSFASGSVDGGDDATLNSLACVEPINDRLARIAF
jgi:hypothetical protein